MFEVTQMEHEMSERTLNLNCPLGPYHAVLMILDLIPWT